jgi:hypothetical protein
MSGPGEPGPYKRWENRSRKEPKTHMQLRRVRHRAQALTWPT